MNTPKQPAMRCSFTGSRELTFTSPQVTFGPALSKAHVVGSAIARDSSGRQKPVRLRVDVSWRATAPAEQETFIIHDVDENGTPVTRRLTHLTRDSHISGHVGAIRLNDERNDVTTSEMSSQQQRTDRS